MTKAEASGGEAAPERVSAVLHKPINQAGVLPAIPQLQHKLLPQVSHARKAAVAVVDQKDAQRQTVGETVRRGRLQLKEQTLKRQQRNETIPTSFYYRIQSDITEFGETFFFLIVQNKLNMLKDFIISLLNIHFYS